MSSRRCLLAALTCGGPEKGDIGRNLHVEPINHVLLTVTRYHFTKLRADHDAGPVWLKLVVYFSGMLPLSKSRGNEREVPARVFPPLLQRAERTARIDHVKIVRE